VTGSVRGLIVAKTDIPRVRATTVQRRRSRSVGCDRRFPNGMAAGVSLKGFLMTEEAQAVPQFREERTIWIALAFRIGLN
jgi:hypothetical protein